MQRRFTDLFWNTHQRRPRARWRLVVMGMVFFLLSAVSQVLIFGLENEWVLRFVYPASSIAVSLLVLWLAGRFLDRRPLPDFGLRLNRAWWLDLGFGLLLGALLMALIFLVELAAGWVTVTGTFHTPTAAALFWPAILFGLWHFIAVGISEEVVSRGYLLRNLAEGLNLPQISSRAALLLAYVLSSAVFGLLHALNPNASWVSTVLLVAAGLLLGLGFVLTGELAIPIGLHISWNFFQGRVFGFPVSGTQTGSTFIAVEQGGPPLWTGGEFGPEAGLIGLAAVVLGCILTALWVKWRSGRLRWETRLAEYGGPGLPPEANGITTPAPAPEG